MPIKKDKINISFTDLSKKFDQLFPIHRSIVSEGFLSSVKILWNTFDYKLVKFITGSKVYDWTVPKSYKVNNAYIITPDKKKICDFKKNNLHLINNSHSIKKFIELKDLKKILITNKKLPTAIPYSFSYYKKKSGFCISYNEFKKLKKGKYEILIDSNFKSSNMIVAESVVKTTERNKHFFLLSSYLCHPQMANNELSGPLVLKALQERLSTWSIRNLNYRFVINPETIGSIFYINRFKKQMKKNLVGGIVLTCLGGPEKKISFKKTRNENQFINEFFDYFKQKKIIDIRDYTPLTGSDERQYNSTGIDLPVGQITRTEYLKYKEYHTSLDDKKFMSIDQILKSVNKLEKLIFYYDNFFPIIVKKQKNFEVFLDKYGLYKDKKKNPITKTILILLGYSDSKTRIFEIVKKFDLDLNNTINAISLLKRNKIISLKV